MVEDCGCAKKPDRLHVRRLNGFTAGWWGSLSEGMTGMVPHEVVMAHPHDYELVEEDGEAEAEAEAEVDAADLASMTVSELRTFADLLGIEVPPKVKKAELVQLLSELM